MEKNQYQPTADERVLWALLRARGPVAYEEELFDVIGGELLGVMGSSFNPFSSKRHLRAINAAKGLKAVAENSNIRKILPEDDLWTYFLKAHVQSQGMKATAAAYQHSRHLPRRIIIELILRDNKRAIDLIIEAYKPFGRKMLENKASDLEQEHESLLNLALTQVMGQKKALKKEKNQSANFFTYLFKVLKNKIYDAREKRNRPDAPSASGDMDRFPEADNKSRHVTNTYHRPSEKADFYLSKYKLYERAGTDDPRLAVRWLIERLDDADCFTVLTLFFHENYGHEAISEHTNWSEAKSKKTKQRCIEKLRNLFKDLKR